MLARENVLEQALAQIFDGQPVGVDITFMEIAAAWARLGLRKSDLHDAIHEMVESEYLIPRNLAGSLGFALSHQGAQRFSTCRQQQDFLQNWLNQRRELQQKA
jgi:hypothetical protein